MYPTALIFSRYRSFKDRTRVNLAPLNVIIGRNGSGKSVISRLSLILSGGLQEEADAPIDLFSGGVLHGRRYEDLIFERSSQAFELGAEIRDGNRITRFVTALRFVVERHEVVVESFELFENEELICELVIASPDEFTRQKPSYRCVWRRDQDPVATAAYFNGLFPDWVECDDALTENLKRHRTNFKRAFADPSYLGPFRSQAIEGPTLPAQGIRMLGPRGERTGDMIADDSLRGGGELAAQVEKWFDESMGGSSVIVKRSEGQARLVVFDKARNLEVELSETGAGFAQVLPVVVQTFARTLGKINSPLLITEQPELHLHPAAHGAVADLFVKGVKAATSHLPVRILCETHSEQIVMRLRRRLAEGTLVPDQVKFHSVAHQNTLGGPIEPIREINFDTAGTPDAWPVGVFDEAFQDLVELRQAVQDKKTN